MKKVLVLGSGALKIGEAGEFDYSGSQALKALKEEGIESVLINPNIATIQTSKELSSKIYFLPVTPYFVEQVIKKEKVDGIFLGFGGQTALNCGLALSKSGVFKKYGVKVLGTPVKSIEVTEDRELFANTLAEIGINVPKGGFARSIKETERIAKKLGFPLLIRSAFSLGGLGSGVVNNQDELIKTVSTTLRHVPQVAIEEYLKHWKEVEYEVVRDNIGNKITVCNMENLDPLGIHTGESIVVAPSQTLNNYQYHFLRRLSLKVIEHLGIVGECNIQFALNPKNNDYRVIEVNARLSRSSALASKATGYPLAYIAAKIGLGYNLPELKNSVTLSTSAFFEPALDYIVVKIPRWDLQKFVGAHQVIGSEMKSVGEVMAIGRSFPEALQKAIRMLETQQDGLLSNSIDETKLLPSTQRIFVIAQRFKRGESVEEIYTATGIDPWFLYQIKQMVEFEKKLKAENLRLNAENILNAKRLGFSDKVLAQAFKTTEEKVRDFRKEHGITPKVKHIDTLAAEYPAKTNYLYLTYHGEESEERERGKGKRERGKAIVLGSGPYRIGSSVEFDWCSVTCAKTLRAKTIETIVINCNPETVSTDYDIADKLYFEELTYERVSDIYDIEKNASLVLGFGGQVPNNLALSCFKAGYKILGTSPQNIDRAEDRNKFSALLDKLRIEQPQWSLLKTFDEAVIFAKMIGYPALIRPSYVLSGAAMNVAYSTNELKKYLKQAIDVSSEHPVVISKFVEGAKEIEIDGVGQNGNLLIYAISEHIENAGVHSGDATMVLPPQRLYLETVRKIKDATRKILKELKINGPFNIQFLAKDNKILVIELNLRASRSFPFVSKVTGYNFVEMATRVILGEHLSGDFKTIDLDYVGVKAPQFSFNRIKGADPRLRVEMSSTGEVACFGDDLEEGYLKALLATGFKLPEKSVFLSIGGEKNKLDFLPSAIHLYGMGLRIFATEGTSKLLQSAGINNTKVRKISERKYPTVVDLLREGKIDLAINISESGLTKVETDGYLIRRNCIDLGIPLMTNLQSAELLISALTSKEMEDLEIKSWDEYVSLDK
ncbi:carbamoyl phosphate synthase large subunit [Candidatus Daviesbacteria bacterium RIFCSPLOWO2_01_FULL_39_12]|uniref:Carbamoyl phosphate synthase large subunit n=1 Tax=Candidatus Daviesbacteria bacterium RIFCSPLOWO2_01_FULL_39_12 TaxID=1797785 RepID=A0A1F5KQE1_9BACT|nr:MAG: carbamoyl phosphate synthase large subunit [Candidatus Daviesbacteria bacterium RIFCSPLOWO2_01_FULL_39_12]